MNKNEMIQFINDNPTCFLATSEGDQPHVRAIMTFRADENGIIFITGTQKDMNKQLLNNPKAELCYYNNEKGRQLRLTGRLEKSDDESLKSEIIEKFTFLKPVAEQYGLGALTVWRLPHGSAVLWSYESPAAPKEPFGF
jgi:pyridoxamine 5'-phosphate oxidase